MSKTESKILFVCTEDWFFYSHFLPLVKAADSLGETKKILVTTPGEKSDEVGRLGVRIVPVDFDRSSMGAVSALNLLVRLIVIFVREKPDILHFIALKPIIVGGLAARFCGRASKVYHLTGRGFFSLEEGKGRQKIGRTLFRLTTWYLRRPKSWLLVENPDDGLALGKYGRYNEDRQTVLGGAGVDPARFPALSLVKRDPVRLAFVGRLVWSKGVDVLVEALDLLKRRNVRVHLDLYGEPDVGNPRSLTLARLDEWNRRDDVSWHGRSENVVEVWRAANIAIVPSRGGEGMPRAMLEAASCARPLIVSDVPGCRHFVRDEVEGFKVPAQDPQALADAIARLAGDFERQKNMGLAARARVLESFTERHVIDDVAAVYRTLLAGSGTD